MQNKSSSPPGITHYISSSSMKNITTSYRCSIRTSDFFQLTPSHAMSKICMPSLRSRCQHSYRYVNVSTHLNTKYWPCQTECYRTDSHCSRRLICTTQALAIWVSCCLGCRQQDAGPHLGYDAVSSILFYATFLLIISSLRSCTLECILQRWSAKPFVSMVLQTSYCHCPVTMYPITLLWCMHWKVLEGSQVPTSLAQRHMCSAQGIYLILPTR